jgi:hypothetical protein
MTEPVVDKARRAVEGELDADAAFGVNVGPVSLQVEVERFCIFDRRAEKRDLPIFGQRCDDVVIVIEEIAEFSDNLGFASNDAEHDDMLADISSERSGFGGSAADRLNCVSHFSSPQDFSRDETDP